MRKFTPPEYSVVDSLGNRTLLLDIDIMIENGERFFRTFRYKAPVRLDFKIGWYVDCETLSVKFTRLIHISKNATTCASV